MAHQEDEEDMAPLDESRLEALIATVECLSDDEAVTMMKSRLKPHELEELLEKLPVSRSSTLRAAVHGQESASQQPANPEAGPQHPDETVAVQTVAAEAEAPKVATPAASAPGGTTEPGTPPPEQDDEDEQEDGGQGADQRDNAAEARATEQATAEATTAEATGEATSEAKTEAEDTGRQAQQQEALWTVGSTPAVGEGIEKQEGGASDSHHKEQSEAEAQDKDSYHHDKQQEQCVPTALNDEAANIEHPAGEAVAVETEPTEAHFECEPPLPSPMTTTEVPRQHIPTDSTPEVVQSSDADAEASLEEAEVMTTASPPSEGIVEAWVIGRDSNGLPTTTASRDPGEASQEIRAACPGQFNFRAHGSESLEELETRLDQEFHGAPASVVPEDAEFVTQANFLLSLPGGSEREAALEQLSLEELALLLCNIDYRRCRVLLSYIPPERRADLRDILPPDKAAQLGLISHYGFEPADRQSPSSSSPPRRGGSSAAAVGHDDPDDDVEFLPLPQTDRFSSMKTTAGAVAGIAAMAAVEGSTRAAEKFRGFSEKARTSEFGEKAMATSSKAFDAAGSAAGKAAHTARSSFNHAAEKVRTSEFPDRAKEAASSAAVLARAGTADLAEKAKNTAASMKDKVNASSAAGAAKSGLSSMSKSVTSFLKKR
mmetsp:Transcript_40560/g.87050  ORF Transcript_40560/g.87050 Transcript_40560/m.87050 type:complete len:660 (+) Transcript_40560:176-2155(+)|eukprot:CAMPEP_0206445058 /NCGR_PEP_ID=MMETSP0324_2-20121206/15271_1 /ASSEMBLY_ACC=CAM_ASM_000836 /TAXON_ID=2866 /ORGANISM="Crypthecodinium cohnii, Strain Seligo" /LENGTH=659 /DNA_ID=CAMNT_0053913179 /DNA_START=167 /DNA_END=2146 /DNA_ORIENTATION=+